MLVSFHGSSTFTRAFRADGTFLDHTPNATPVRGAWSIEQDSTRTLVFDGTRTTTDRYWITGDTPRLGTSDSFECDAMCRRVAEDRTDVEPETVQNARIVCVSTFTQF